MKIIETLSDRLKKHPSMEYIKKLWKVIYRTIFTFNLHGGTENAGYLAFSIIFAIFPFMIFFMMLIGYLGQTEIGIRLLAILQDNLPEDMTKTLLPAIDGVIKGPKTGILSIATLTLIWNASSFVDGLKSTLNRAYRIRPTKLFLLGKIGSVIKFLLMTNIIIVAIFSTIVFPKILILVDQFVPLHYNANSLLLFLKPFLLPIFLFIFIVSIYFIVPSKINKFKDIFWGSVLTLVGWMVSLKTLTFYLQKMANFQVIYGSLTGIIITLFFFNLMTIILIFGAEFNSNLSRVFNGESVP